MTKLLPFQKVGVRLIEKFNGRVLLADEMGLGKTIQAIMYAHRNRIRPILVICPASLKYHWQREMAHHCGMYAEVLETRKVPKGEFMRKRNVIIINYDILGAWLPYIIGKLQPTLVVIDEVQSIKSPGAKRTKYVQQICKGIKHIIAISGTPLTNRPAELWTTLNILWPRHYKNFWQFAHKFCKPRLRRWGWEFKGAVNLPRLHRDLLRRGMIRRLKKDVLKDLPHKQRVVISVKIDNTAEYEQAEKEFIKWLRSNYSVGKAKRAASAQRLVQFGYLKRLAAQGKLKSVMEWIDNFLEESDGKLIVFAIHKSFIKTLMARYHKIAVKVDGSVTGQNRQHAVDLFTKSKKCRLIILNIQAGGTGWNGTAASTTLIAELPWTPGEVTQAEKRMDRIGQKFPMTSVFLVARNTIEEKLCKILDDKQGILSATLDGNKHVEALNIMNKLTKSLIRSSR